MLGARSLPRRSLAAVLMVLAVATFVSPASADRAPTGAEKLALVRGLGAPASAAPCLRFRISTVNPHFARVTRLTQAGRCSTFKHRLWFEASYNALVFLKYFKPGGWGPTFIGTRGFQCPVPTVPTSAAKDLGACR